jgi:hypothetical protein
MAITSQLMEIIQLDSKVQELFVKVEKAVTLKALVLIGFKLGLAIALVIVKEVLTDRAHSIVDRPICPKCQTPLYSKGWLPRTVKTLIGILRWKRELWRCPNGCKIGQVAPFDIELGLKPNQRTGDEIKQIACALTVFVPFNIAVTLLKTLTGIEVSSEVVWNWVQCAGREAMLKLEAELVALKDKLPDAEQIEAKIAQLPLLIGGDGVMVPFRPNEGSPEGKTVWQEVKVGILSRLGKRLTSKGKEVSIVVRRRLVAVLGNIDAFKSRMWLASVKEGILEASIVIWISDGGRGFWGVFHDLFSKQAQGILDFYHAAQNIWKGAKSRFDGRTKKANEWFASARHLLRAGKAKQVLDEMKDALKSQCLADSVQKTLKNVLSYLETHIDHISYDRYKELGLPIGSGMVESACKWLIQQRFKCVGMRWSEDGFNNLLHLRLAWVNGNFDILFEPSSSPNL